MVGYSERANLGTLLARPADPEKGGQLGDFGTGCTVGVPKNDGNL
jgi:hypothetical protein